MLKWKSVPAVRPCVMTAVAIRGVGCGGGGSKPQNPAGDREGDSDKCAHRCDSLKRQLGHRPARPNVNSVDRIRAWPPRPQPRVKCKASGATIRCTQWASLLAGSFRNGG